MQSVLPLYHTQPSIPGAAYTTTQQQIMIKERGGEKPGERTQKGREIGAKNEGEVRGTVKIVERRERQLLCKL